MNFIVQNAYDVRDVIGQVCVVFSIVKAKFDARRHNSSNHHVVDDRSGTISIIGVVLIADFPVRTALIITEQQSFEIRRTIHGFEQEKRHRRTRNGNSKFLGRFHDEINGENNENFKKNRKKNFKKGENQRSKDFRFENFVKILSRTA